MKVPDPMDAPGIRWGILGPGGIAHRFAHEVTLYTASTIAAVGSRDIARAKSFVEELFDEDAEVTAYGSYEDLVAGPDIDAIYVSSPHSEHHDHAILALNAGKPVLVEKAFCLNARQAEEVFAVAKDKGLFAMEAMWSRFLPHYHAIKDLVGSDELGDAKAVIAVHSQKLNLDPEWRMMNPELGGGPLLDLGIYPLSFLHFLWGVPDAIHASGVLTYTGVDLRETIMCAYGDRIGTTYTDMEVSGHNGLQVLCESGKICINDWFYTPSVVMVEPDDAEDYVIPDRVAGGFEYEAAEAARRIVAGDQQSDFMTWQDTVEVLRMADEVRRQLGVVYPNE